MPRGYRCLVLALVGWLILAASPPQQDRPRADQADSTQNVEESLRKIAGALNKADEAPEYNPPCDKGKDDRRSNLCAQWKAADAAYESSVWTRRMYPWIVSGTIVGLLTLLAAGAAALYAKRAAVAAQINLAAYQHAERGFVHVDEVKYNAVMGALTRDPWIAFTISNPGRSGVRITKLHGGFREDAMEWRWDEENQFTNVTPTYCKVEKTAQMFGPRIVAGHSLRVFLGVIEYDTLGMIGRKSHFAYSMITPVDVMPAIFVRIILVEGMPSDT